MLSECDAEGHCYPVSEQLLREKHRWKFLDWFPGCYQPCSINSVYIKLHEVLFKSESSSSKVYKSLSASTTPSARVCSASFEHTQYRIMEIISIHHQKENVVRFAMLHDLPEHIHMSILECIHPNERFTTISTLSRYWYRLVNRKCFWREIRIHLKLAQLYIDSLKAFLLKAQMHVEKICISSCTEPYPDHMLMNAFPSVMPHVKVLDIGFYEFLSVGMVEFFLKCFPNLEELNVEGAKATGSVVYSTLLINGFPKLRKLFISYSVPFSRDDYLQFCQVNRPIEVLSVDGDDFLGNYAATCLADSAFVTTLTRLYLDGEELNDFGFRALTACKNLKLLSISFCENLTDLSLSYAKTLINLDHLHLRKGKEFTTAGLLKFFELSDENTVVFPKKLRFLNLSECPAVIDCVVDVITRSCPELRSLNLAWNWLLTDKSFTVIAERLKELQFLDLMGMDSITASALHYVPDLFLSKLRFLNVVQCSQFDETSLRMLQLRKKDLVIVNYYSYHSTVTLYEDGNVSFGERCDAKYVHAISDFLRQFQGYCCMSSGR